MKNVVVLGGSYSGARAAEQLSQGLPPDYRVILVDKRSHFAHLYGFGRNAVVPGGAHRLFIPYTNLLGAPAVTKDSCPRNASTRHLVVQAAATRITSDAVWVDQDLCDILDDAADTPFNVNQCCKKEVGGCCGDFRKTETRIPYAFLVYALGSQLPPPIATSALTKKDLISFLKVQQGIIHTANSILIVGGGALGIQFATDIKELYPEKKVTLIHSRSRFLPLFDKALHDETIRRFRELDIDYVLNDRLILPARLESCGVATLMTQRGRSITSDLRIFATGQKPNSQLLGKFSPCSLDSHNYIKVKRTMQLADPANPNIFAIGDVIDGFGAIKAGHTGWNQANVAAENILKIVKARQGGLETPLLTEYVAGKPQIKVTLGLKHAVSQILDPDAPGEVKTAIEDKARDEDDDARLLWQAFKMPFDE